MTTGGHTLPSDAEIANAEAAVKDGAPDTSQEFRAAGRAAAAEWTLSGQLERIDHPPARLPDGTEEEGWTSYRVEVGGQAADLRYFLMPDGRLFRLVSRGPREAGCELRGWETRGPYLAARPEIDGWSLEVSSAGASLPGLSTLRLLLAAELVDLDEALAERVASGA